MLTCPCEFALDVTTELANLGTMDLEAMKVSDTRFHNVNISGILVTAALGVVSNVRLTLVQNHDNWVVMPLAAGVVHRMRLAKLSNTSLTASKVIIMGVIR